MYALMRNKLLWILQLIINEVFMLKVFSHIESVYYKVENGCSIILSMILVIVFLLVGYIFTNILRKSK